MRNTREHWGSVARGFHWTMAILLLAQWILGRIGSGMARSPGKLELLSWHKSLGITLLALVLLRLAWRALNPTPAAPAGEAPWARWAARASHALLYLLMIGLPISGWLLSSAENLPFRWFWLFSVPDLAGPDERLAETAEEWHEWLATGLALLVILHVLAALRHHFIEKTNVLRRMLSGHG